MVDGSRLGYVFFFFFLIKGHRLTVTLGFSFAESDGNDYNLTESKIAGLIIFNFSHSFGGLTKIENRNFFYSTF